MMLILDVHWQFLVPGVVAVNAVADHVSCLLVFVGLVLAFFFFLLASSILDGTTIMAILTNIITVLVFSSLYFLLCLPLCPFFVHIDCLVNFICSYD